LLGMATAWRKLGGDVTFDLKDGTPTRGVRKL